MVLGGVDGLVAVAVDTVGQVVGHLGGRGLATEGAVGDPDVEVVVHRGARGGVGVVLDDGLPVQIDAAAGARLGLAGDGEVARHLLEADRVDLGERAAAGGVLGRGAAGAGLVIGVGDPHEVEVLLGLVQRQVAIFVQADAVGVLDPRILGAVQREGLVAELVAAGVAGAAGVEGAVVRRAVAVVVLAVADLLGPGMDQRVFVVAVLALGAAEAVPVVVVVCAVGAG